LAIRWTRCSLLRDNSGMISDSALDFRADNNSARSAGCNKKNKLLD
jgi:hypothetical protein